MTEATESEVAGTTVTIFDNGHRRLAPRRWARTGRGATTVTLLAQGANSITASDTDLAGNSGTSSAGDATRWRRAAPAVAISTPGGQTNQASQTITGTVTEATESEVAGTTVTIFDNGSQIGTATVGSDGAWSDHGDAVGGAPTASRRATPIWPAIAGPARR